MYDLFRVSLVQVALHWEDKVGNRAHLESILSNQPAGCTDLYLLPEMFTTGFSMYPQGLAEEMQGPTVSWLRQMASSTQAAIGGSIIIRETNQFYNRFVLLSPDGSIQFYDKRHLFTLAGEQRVYQPGQTNLLWEYRGWRIRPLVCYDLRFPVWSRNTDHYDLLIYVANWPAKRSLAWKTLLPARAIENQCYTAGVNRLGVDPNGNTYEGNSQIIDYAGNIICHAGGVEGVFTQELSLPALKKHRQELNFLADQDTFNLI